MIFFKLLLLIFVTVLSLSCNSTKIDEKNISINYGKIKLNYVKDVNLILDSNTTPVVFESECFFNVSTKEEEIAFVNESMNSLQFYNLSGRKIRQTNFYKEGPNATGKIQGFLYLNKDSIFVLDNHTNRVFLCSVEGRKLKSFILPESTMKSYFTLPWVESGIEMFHHNSDLYIPGNCGEDYDAKGKENFYSKGLLGIKLNAVNGEVEYRLPYPNKDWIKSKHFPPQTIRPFCIKNPKTNRLVYSFGCDNYIYSMSLDGKHIDKIFMGSRENAKKDLVEMSSAIKFQNSSKSFLHYLNNLYYGKLYYDSYRELYYRLVKKPIKTEYTDKDLIMRKQIDVNYSLIISDSNFNILNEVPLKPGLGKGAILISKRGVLIEKYSGNEDNLSYELFSLTK